MIKVRQTIHRFIHSGSILLVCLLSLQAASLKEVADFGDNPTKLKMFIYIPDNVAAKPPVLVGLHWCHGTAQAYFSSIKQSYATLADSKGFIIICPNANSSDSCFDVHSEATLTHDKGGDSKGIASMIRYALAQHHADSNSIYCMGHSSGGMMTEVMAGSYPELFKSVSASAGVPFGCFGGGSSYWNDDCAKGRINKTGQQWGDLVRSAHPGYAGRRPKIQLWHGTSDDVLLPVNFDEGVKQWINVLGLKETPATTDKNMPLASYTRYRYQDSTGTIRLEAIKADGQPHNIKLSEAAVISFLGLDLITPVAPRQAVSVKHSPPNTPHCSVRRISNTISGFTFTTAPGFVQVDTYNLDGSKCSNLLKKYTSTGIISTTCNTSRLSGISVMTVSVNGSVCLSQRLILLR